MKTTENTPNYRIYNLRRDGKLPLRFRGILISEADDHSHSGDRQNCWTIVRIYRTTGGRVVVKVIQRTLWAGESDDHSAESLGSSRAAIAWLIDANGGTLGSASQDAIIRAGEVDPEFAAAFDEYVD